eukprot:TRINITY_DN2694_c0_g1_i1.p1 TRINITY_DN2694_c0_g1~~TRINITY_DN2694_c0_g1_i1.p1  ORF type:complete len:192 (+),score=18.22 TRINITY_DN2694_c0_g1_i1:75-650(+)
MLLPGGHLEWGNVTPEAMKDDKSPHSPARQSRATTRARSTSGGAVWLALTMLAASVLLPAAYVATRDIELSKLVTWAGSFGGGGSGGSTTGDREVELRLSLEQLFFGGAYNASLLRSVVCGRCSGSGAESPDDVVLCPHCHGQGVTTTHHRKVSVLWWRGYCHPRPLSRVWRERHCCRGGSACGPCSTRHT